MMTSCGVDYIEISEPPTGGLSEELAAIREPTYHPPIPRKSWFKEFDATLARTEKELGNTVAANGPLPQKETPSRIRAWGRNSGFCWAARGVGGWVPTQRPVQRDNYQKATNVPR